MESLSQDQIGKHIATFRKQKRLSQRKLAEKLHTDASMVTRWETGKVLPRIETLEKIAGILEIDVQQLLQGQNLGASAPDGSLQQMLQKVSMLDSHDQEALKSVISAMLMRAQMKGYFSSQGAA